jgi:hypothetical protein
MVERTEELRQEIESFDQTRKIDGLAKYLR